MSILRNIRLADGRRFYLCDNTAENDDRTIEDEDGAVCLRIDSQTAIRYPEGACITRMRYGVGERWIMQFQGHMHDLIGMMQKRLDEKGDEPDFM